MPFVRTPAGKLKMLERTPSEVLDIVKKDGVQFIDLQFTDLFGRLQHTTIPAETLDASCFSEGVPKLDGSSIRGFVEIHESDLILTPDPSTYGVLPWFPPERKIARMICNVSWGFDLGRLSRDPRAIAQKAEQVLAENGYETSYWGPEVEFFVFDKVHWDVMTPYRGMSYSIESREAAWTTTGNNYPIRFKEGYFPASPQDTLVDFRSECSRILRDNFGIVCDAHHHEVATAGQCEIDMYRDTLTNMADSVMTYKHVVKNVAAQRGMITTMMPKPVFMDNASGMHVHVSLWRDGVNLFYDESDEYAELSQLARYFSGGLMEHARSLAPICTPTSNSYRRLVPGYEAPVYIAWSCRNRSANIRIPIYRKGPQNAASKRIEYRAPDPTANPYLCFAALAAAGLDGIKNKIDMGDPVDEDIYRMNKAKREKLGIKELPGTLKEAVECLQSDQDYLKPIFPQDAIDKIIEQDMKEYNEIALRPHPYEFHLTFDV